MNLIKSVLVTKKTNDLQNIVLKSIFGDFIIYEYKGKEEFINYISDKSFENIIVGYLAKESCSDILKVLYDCKIDLYFTENIDIDEKNIEKSALIKFLNYQLSLMYNQSLRSKTIFIRNNTLNEVHNTFLELFDFDKINNDLNFFLSIYRLLHWDNTKSILHFIDLLNTSDDARSDFELFYKISFKVNLFDNFLKLLACNDRAILQNKDNLKVCKIISHFIVELELNDKLKTIKISGLFKTISLFWIASFLDGESEKKFLNYISKISKMKGGNNGGDKFLVKSLSLIFSKTSIINGVDIFDFKPTLKYETIHEDIFNKIENIVNNLKLFEHADICEFVFGYLDYLPYRLYSKNPINKNKIFVLLSKS